MPGLRKLTTCSKNVGFNQLTLYCAFLIGAIVVVLSIGCRNPQMEYVSRSITESDQGEDMSDELTEPTPRTVEAVTICQAYYIYNNAVYGMPEGVTLMSGNVYIGSFPYFDVADGKIYFGVTDTRINEAGDGYEQYTRNFIQTGTDLEETDSEYIVPELERVTFASGDFHVEIESYEGQTISAVYYKNYREPMIFVSGAYMSGDTLMFSAPEGRGNSRPQGFYRWQPTETHPYRINIFPGTVKEL